MDTPAIYYPKPLTLQHFTSPQKMPFCVKQTQEQEQIEYDSPPPITLDYVELVGEQGIKLPTDYSDAVATSLVGVIVVVSLVAVTLALIVRKV